MSKVARIDAKWIGWYPTRGWYIGFWAEVAREVSKQKVRRSDRAGVVRVCREVSARMPRKIELGENV